MSKLPPLPHWCESGSPFAEQMQAYATAATEPLLQRIAELEEMNAQLREQNTEVDKACADLERQLEEVHKDAERWKMTIEINQDVLRHPDSRKIPASVSAYMNAIHKGYDMTYAVDAAIDAAMQNDNHVGVVFQKGQA